VIDGCPLACARKTVEHLGLHITDYLEVMSEGIIKTNDFDLNPNDISRIVAHALETLESNATS
jgi:uncharacterized metal-binding protein